MVVPVVRHLDRAPLAVRVDDHVNLETRRLSAPCFLTFHSPLPSTFSPVLVTT